MDLENGHLYHIFNQGNNKHKIFYINDNYIFFLNKVRKHILPFADIVAWCLMPNHFHLMVFVNLVEINPSRNTRSTASNPIISGSATPSRAPTPNMDTLNKSIGIMLASYTRAINRQENSTGSLFRAKTKAECLTKSDGVVPSFYNTSSGAKINVPLPEKEYPQICFNYIHNNPVISNLVEHPKDWEFSSYRDYCGLRNGRLVNKNRAVELGLALN
jgi:putative transposase